MVNLNDIKKGNQILDFDGQIISVENIYERSITCQENDNIYTSSGLDGIKLRLPIVIWNFGFEVDENKPNGELVAVRKLDIIIAFKSQGVFVYVGNTFIAHIHYVHQLENLLSFLLPKPITPKKIATWQIQ